MTWRCIYGEPFPYHHDAPTEAEAEAFAEEVVRRGEAGVVTVVEVFHAE